MTLISTEWLNKNLSKVKIIDASWHLKKDRNALAEYKKIHIENAIFMDLDEVSNKEKNYCRAEEYHQKYFQKKLQK